MEGETTEPRGPRLVALVPRDGQEPPPDFPEAKALGARAAVTSLWHPAILARVEDLPHIEAIEFPTPAEANDLIVLADGSSDDLPSGFRVSSADVGARVVQGSSDRREIIAEVLTRLDPEASLDAKFDPIALDFVALGTADWMLRDLTIGMGHADGLDRESFRREVLAGARAWSEGDHATAKNRLRAAFELLTQARERFYPVDAYLIDLVLLDPASPPDGIPGLLEARAPFTFLASARAIDALAGRRPEIIAALREAITEGWADVIGGAYDEVDEPLLPIESIAWQFLKGGEVYRRHLDDRNVETLAQRRFCLYPQRPQIARRFGFRFAVYLGLDDGRFPLPAESKRLWESVEGSHLESLTRAPIGANSSVAGLRLPWRLAKSMKEDHVATVPIVQWPSPTPDWLDDLRRVAAYSPVLARWVTAGDYFHRTDRPFEMYRPEDDQFVMPYLSQAVARRDPTPISGRVGHARTRARLDASRTILALERLLDPSRAGATSLDAIEDELETQRLGSAPSNFGELELELSQRLSTSIIGQQPSGIPGYLVLNPTCIARRAAVLLPDAPIDLAPAGPLRAAQFTEEGVYAVVDLPAFGYAWVARDNSPGPPQPASVISTGDRTLRNESIEIEIDPSTGGLRSLKAPGEPTPRLGQQLVIAGLADKSRMRAESVEIEYGGPALAQAVSKGVIVGPEDRTLGRFTQRFRLWSGRPTFELDITLDDLDPDWLAAIESADPWSRYIACRWAWPDEASMVRRTALLHPSVTEVERPETPDAIDISTRRQRTAILFGGLAHHRRHGGRMLDTLLVAGRESARRFRVGVSLEREHPYQAAFDMLAPALVVPCPGPPPSGLTGWFVRLDHPAVAVTRVEPVSPRDENEARTLAFHLIETAGHAARCRLRLVRDPSWAKQTDFNGEIIVDLPVDGDSVLVDLTPHELIRVEVTL